MKNDSDERLTLDVFKAAQLLGISRNLAYDMVKAGNLPVVKLGKRLLVPKKALEQMLESDRASRADSSR